MKHAPVTKTPVKDFFLRGLMFGGFGPIVVGIVYLCLNMILNDFSLSGVEVFTAIISTYVLAFVHAGASVFNQIESCPLGKSTLCHFGILYITYVLCYVINFWIPFEPAVLGIFTAIFVIGYTVVWLTVYLSVNAAAKRLNRSLRH